MMNPSSRVSTWRTEKTPDAPSMFGTTERRPSYAQPCSVEVLMNMRRVSLFTIVTLLMLQTVAMNLTVPAQAAAGRGGGDDDYAATAIVLGNASVPASEWIQADGSVMQYIYMDEPIEVKMTVQRLGTGFTGESAPATLEIVHPIGFVMQTFNWNTAPIVGGQSDNNIFEWTPDAAHSILNTSTNDLEGGLILRATVHFPDDDRNTNDVFEKTVPVAVSSDPFDGTASSLDPTFFSGKYPANGGDAFDTGSWQVGTGSSAEGTKHWRHSSPGSNYPSGAEATRLVAGQYMSGQSCPVETQLDPGLTQTYQTYICRRLFFSGEFVSSQFHIQAWGSMAAGDAVSLELWRGSGNLGDAMESISWDIAQGNPSQATDQWTNVSWDPQTTWEQIPGLAFPEIFLGGNSYSYGLLFTSDSSGASEGFHVDDFVHFGVSKVSDYTLDLQCDNPSSGYTVAPNQMAILECTMTNNGYSPATVRIETNVTNDSWMAPYPVIRMDIEGSNNHGTNVIIPPIGAGATVEFWVNLTVPAGADVQQQTWELWFTDASSAQLGEKGRFTMDLAVSEQYGVALTSTVGLEAADIGPGEYGLVEFRLQNTGNKDAAFNLATSYSEDTGWAAVIQNETGVIQQNPLSMFKGEARNLVLNISAPTDASPGTVSFNLRATCPSCNTPLYGTDVLVRNIEVPVLRDVHLETDEYTITGAANGNSKVVYISIFNLGNDDEQFNLSLSQNNWRLEAALAAEQTPTMDAWDGESTIVLNLPMPIGLSPGIYNVKVTATSVDDSSVKGSIDISVEILDTAATYVSDEDPGQSYIPGDLPQTMSFEVRNDGNSIDSFAMSMELPNGMQASFTNLMGDSTPEIEIGASFNVTVEFSFLDGAEGQLTLQITATSNSDDAVSATGQATYLVGSQNWLKIYAIQPISINEEGDYEVLVRVKNQYTDAQVVVMELDDGETKSWFQTKISSNDRNFVLAVNEEREVTITVDVSATTLSNLGMNELTTNLTVWARSDTVSDAADATMQVTLVKSSSDDQGDAASSEDGLQLDVIGLWAVFILVIVAGVFMLMSILNVEEEDDEYANWGEDGYEDSLSATYGAVAAAPSVPTSMPSPEPMASPSVVQNITYNISDSAVSGDFSATAPVAAPAVAEAPPLPDGGLPAGWTMEQWNVYGQQWLEQNGQA